VISKRSWFLIVLTVLAGAAMFSVWHKRSAAPCVEGSALRGPAPSLTLAAAHYRAHLLLVQDDDDDPNAPSPYDPVDSPCASALSGRNSMHAATALGFVLVLAASIFSVVHDRRILRRHAWSMRVMRGEGGRKS
jgi:hypothetical protein